MIKDITIGQFFPGNSFIHKLDARTKIVLTIAILVIIFLCGNFFALGIVTSFVLFSFLLTRLSVKLVLKSFKPLIPIIRDDYVLWLAVLVDDYDFVFLSNFIENSGCLPLQKLSCCMRIWYSS